MHRMGMGMSQEGTEPIKKKCLHGLRMTKAHSPWDPQRDHMKYITGSGISLRGEKALMQTAILSVWFCLMVLSI